EMRERLADVRRERVVADLRDHRGPAPEPRGRHGHVGRGAAETLREARDVGQVHADLLGVEVHADPADRDDLGLRHARIPLRYSTLACTSAAGPLPFAGSASSITSCSSTYQPA